MGFAHAGVSRREPACAGRFAAAIAVSDRDPGGCARHLDRRAGDAAGAGCLAALVDYVLPPALLDTALLLGGVGALSLAIGTGTAWAISLHEFRGRQLLLWLVPLPLAIPTYLAAYVYVDLFEPLGLVHRTLASGFRCRTRCACFPTCARCPARSS